MNHLTTGQLEYSRHRWLILFILSMGAFLSPLDFFIVNVALSDIKSSLQATDTALQLVVAGYGLTYAVLVVTGGRLGDIYGRKRVFITGMAIFIFASAACALSPNTRMLIIARIVQGAGAAMLAPQVMATIRVIFPPVEQPKAMGIFGAAFGLASIAGQLLGGLLIKARFFGWTWESVFMVNIPVGILCSVAAMLFMEENRSKQRTRLDIGGMLLVTLTLVLFIFPIVEGREANWPWWVFGSMIISVITGIVLFRFETRLLKQGKAALLYVPLFKKKSFLKGITIIFLYNFTAAFFLVFPYYLQNSLHWNAFDAGLSILPYAAGFFVAPLLSPRLGLSSGVLVKGGLLLLTAGFLIAAVAIYGHSQPGILLGVGLFFAGCGHGTVMPAMLREVMSSVRVELVGQAAGIVSTAIQVGGVVGAAVIGSLFFSLIATCSFETALIASFFILAFIQCAGWLIARNYFKHITI